MISAGQRVICFPRLHDRCGATSCWGAIPWSVESVMGEPILRAGAGIRAEWIRWKPVGLITMDDAGDLVFPSVPAVPGVYRFTIKEGAEAEIVAEYVGQAAVSLVQRFSGYRRRGRKPALPLEKKTTSRNARKIIDALLSGQVVSVAIVDDRAVAPDGQVVVVNLADKALRDKLEKDLIEWARGTGAEVLNR